MLSCFVGVNPDLPWIMMMNGANCYARDYKYLLRQLAGRGYLAVSPTQLHPPPEKFKDNDLLKGNARKPKLIIAVSVTQLHPVQKIPKTMTCSKTGDVR